MSTRVHDFRRAENFNFNHNHKHAGYNHHKYGNSVFNGYGKRYEEEEESNKGGFGKTLGLVALAAGAYGIGTSKGANIGQKTGNFLTGILSTIGNLFGAKPAAK